MKKYAVFIAAFILIVSTIAVIADTPEKLELDLKRIDSNHISTSIDNSDGNSQMQSSENLFPVNSTEHFSAEPEKVVSIKPEFNVTISGKVKLPDGKLAPKGGLKVNIEAGINPNTMNYQVLRSEWPFPVNGISIVIPEGKNGIDYEIPVVNYYKVNNKEYKPWYALMFYYNYTKDGSLEYQGDFYKGPLDLSQGSLENIDYTFENYNLNN